MLAQHVCIILMSTSIHVYQVQEKDMKKDVTHFVLTSKNRHLCCL